MNYLKIFSTVFYLSKTFGIAIIDFTMWHALNISKYSYTNKFAIAHRSSKYNIFADRKNK